MVRLFSQYVPRRAIALLLSDTVVMAAAFSIGVRLRYFGDPEAYSYYLVMPEAAYRVGAAVGVFVICAYYNGLYDLRTLRGWSDHFFRLAQAMGFGCFALSMLYYFWPALRVGRGAFVAGVAAALLGVVVFRALADRSWRSFAPPENVAVVGDGPLAAATAREIDFRRDLNMRLAGFVSLRKPDEREPRPAIEPAQRLGYADAIEDIVRDYSIRRLVVALEEPAAHPPYERLLRLRTRGVAIEDAHALNAALTARIPLTSVNSSWFLFSEGFRRSRYQTALKRLLDLTISLTGLLVSAPVMAAVALAVKLDSKGPALFRQRRVGLNGKCFELLKFRTMRVDAEADGVARWASENDPRVTRIGGFLRKYRLDELPQFLNVIRAHMSFVGPRPERPEFVERLRQSIPYYDERHTVRPGITGWAQVCYPYGATEEDALRKLEYDLFYLKNVSILFDIAIVFQTVKIVITGRGR